MLTWIVSKLWGNAEGWRIEAHDGWDKKIRYTLAAPGERMPAPRERNYGENQEKNYYDSLEEAAAKVPGTVFPLELRAVDDTKWRPDRWELVVKCHFDAGWSAYAHYGKDGDLNLVYLYSPEGLSLDLAKAWCARVFAVFQESRDWDQYWAEQRKKKG
jgi:hypothetical protein